MSNWNPASGAPSSSDSGKDIEQPGPSSSSTPRKLATPKHGGKSNLESLHAENPPLIDESRPPKIPRMSDFTLKPITLLQRILFKRRYSTPTVSGTAHTAPAEDHFLTKASSMDMEIESCASSSALPTTTTPSSSQRSLSSISSGCSARSGSGDDSAEPTLRRVIRMHTHRRLPIQSTTPLSDSEVEELMSDYPIRFLAMHSHRRSLLILPEYCFELSADKVPTDDKLRKKLGVCVTYKQRTCTESDCRPCPGVKCNACPHKYSCDCAFKWAGTDWCPHIHVMQMMRTAIFEESVCLFINATSKKMELRHLRAFVLGPNKMKRIKENVYVERFEDNNRHSKPYHVKVTERSACYCLPNEKCNKCEACICRYVCTCEDYWRYKRVCEHCHIVAMSRHPYRERLFGDSTTLGFNLSDTEDEIDTEGLYLIDEEHERSLDIQFKQIMQIEKDERWTIKIDDEIFIIRADQPKLACICGDNPSRYLHCMECRVCFFHYSCSCWLAEKTICRHVHAIHQYLTEYEERSDEEYYKASMLEEEQPINPEDFDIREPIEPLKPANFFDPPQ